MGLRTRPCEPGCFDILRNSIAEWTNNLCLRRMSRVDQPCGLIFSDLIMDSFCGKHKGAEVRWKNEICLACTLAFSSNIRPQPSTSSKLVKSLHVLNLASTNPDQNSAISSGLPMMADPSSVFAVLRAADIGWISLRNTTHSVMNHFTFVTIFTPLTSSLQPCNPVLAFSGAA